MEQGCTGCGGMNRRAFLASSTVAAVSALLAACGGDATGAQPSGPYTITVADYPALASVGGIAVVNGAVAVVRTDTGYLALSRVCPHQGATVNAASGGFVCPRHGAQFNRTGTWVGGERTSSMVRLTSTFDDTTGVLTVS